MAQIEKVGLIEEEEEMEKIIKMVPKKFYNWLIVFKKENSKRIPVRKPYDYVIELKEGFVPKKAKVIPFSPKEQEEVNAFLDKQLRKGYIRETKFQQISLVFFISKKDRKKRMV